MHGKVVLVCTDRLRTWRQLIPPLSGAGNRIVHAPSTERAVDLLISGAIDLVLVEWPSGVEIDPILEAAGDRVPLIALVTGTGLRGLEELVCRRGMLNLCAARPEQEVSAARLVDPAELVVTCEKILRRDIFGLDKYLTGFGIERLTREISHADQRDDMVAQLASAVRTLGAGRRVVESVSLVADELLTNAVYNAPLDANGKPRYAHVSRRHKVALEPSEHVHVEYGSDGRVFALSVADRFGGFSPERLRSGIERCLTRHDPIEHKEGGAGIGLYACLCHTDHLVFNIEAGAQTEVIAIWHLARKSGGRGAGVASLHVFQHGDQVVWPRARDTTRVAASQPNVGLATSARTEVATALVEAESGPVEMAPWSDVVRGAAVHELAMAELADEEPAAADVTGAEEPHASEHDSPADASEAAPAQASEADASQPHLVADEGGADLSDTGLAAAEAGSADTSEEEPAASEVTDSMVTESLSVDDAVPERIDHDAYNSSSSMLGAEPAVEANDSSPSSLSSPPRAEPDPDLDTEVLLEVDPSIVVELTPSESDAEEDRDPDHSQVGLEAVDVEVAALPALADESADDPGDQALQALEQEADTSDPADTAPGPVIDDAGIDAATRVSMFDEASIDAALARSHSEAEPDTPSESDVDGAASLADAIDMADLYEMGTIMEATGLVPPPAAGPAWLGPLTCLRGVQIARQSQGLGLDDTLTRVRESATLADAVEALLGMLVGHWSAAMLLCRMGECLVPWTAAGDVDGWEELCDLELPLTQGWLSARTLSPGVTMAALDDDPGARRLSDALTAQGADQGLALSFVLDRTVLVVFAARWKANALGDKLSDYEEIQRELSELTARIDRFSRLPTMRRPSARARAG